MSRLASPPAPLRGGGAFVASVLALLALPALAFVPAVPGEASAQTLRGGAASLDRQNAQAQAHNFTYLRTPSDVRSFVEQGYLVPVVPNRDFDVHNVSFPYARPEVRLFIERLASQYRSACGEKLVVTSLTRPQSNQPWNASSRSVHPTGMAVDLRRSQNANCRNWLERTLLSLEGQGLIEAIYERNPPHYHVAVYPQPYARYVARITGSDPATVVTASVPRVEVQTRTHRVAPGETLSRIAERYGVAVARIRADNNLRGDRIIAGQELRIAEYREVRVAEAPTPAPAPAPTSASARAEAPTAVNLGNAPAPAADAPALDAGTAPDTGAEDPVVHRVRSGESLWIIARSYGTTEAAIRAENRLTSTRILAGQELRIPVSAEGLPSSLLHTVRRGESLWTIARQHGISVDDLTRANGIRGSAIHPGQVLEVPVAR